MVKTLSLTLALAVFAAPASAQQAADSVSPEAAISLSAKASGEPVKAKTWMVAVANPLAAEAAADVLRKGGSAADAAIAAQAMLGLVEPQSSGLGGGAFVVYFDAKSGELTTLDGRETAPLAATPQLFQDENGEPLKFFSAVVGGRSVGTPGTPALLKHMHEVWGKTAWRDLLQPAINTATKGFKASPRLAGLVELDQERLALNSNAAAYFLPDGKPVQAGDVLINQPYAKTLQALQSGTGDFYSGQTAKNIVTAVKNHPSNPGVLSLQDFANYTVKTRKPVCAPFIGREVCGMGPPSSGALTVGQILSLSENANIGLHPPNHPNAWRILGDASRLAFADRGRYMADSDYVPMPTKGLLKPDYIKARSKLLGTEKALSSVSPGEPEWDHAFLQGDDMSLELPSTSHLSIIDAEGNAISMTTTIENAFGSRLMVDGFLLNNELTDFSFKTHQNGAPIANRVEPGKRPRSSMSPTIVMKDGKPELIVGSPGGSRIIGYVAKTIVANQLWNMNIQAAINMPHLVNRFGTYDVEAGTEAEKLVPALERMGFTVNLRSLNSGLHAIAIKQDGSLEGGADPRREGIVIGE
jgi:gamma-glutamyltranspeptidase/glutathione hydrolase